MLRKILIFVFSCLLIISLFLFFRPKVALSLALLFFLITLQIALIVKRVRKQRRVTNRSQNNIIRNNSSGDREALIRNVVTKERNSFVQSLQQEERKQKEKPVSNSNTSKAALPKLDPAVLERMNAKIQEAKKQANQGKIISADEDVQVSLSSRDLKNKTITKATIKSNKIATTYGFQNTAIHAKNPLQEKTQVSQKGKLERNKEHSSDLEAISALFDDIALSEKGYTNPNAIVPSKASKEETPQDKKTFGGAHTPIVAEEVWDAENFLAQDNVAKQALLLTQEYYNKKLYKEAYTTLQSFQPEKKAETSPVIKELLDLQCEVLKILKNYSALRNTYACLLEKYPLENKEKQKQRLESIVLFFSLNNIYSEGISFFLTRLSVAREEKDYVTMKRLYRFIAKGYEQRKDNERLLQTYQNHLSASKANKDIDEQIELYDLLGKLLFETGDRKASKECYEQSIVLQKQIEEKEVLTNTSR